MIFRDFICDGFTLKPQGARKKFEIFLVPKVPKFVLYLPIEKSAYFSNKTCKSSYLDPLFLFFPD